MTWAPIMVLSQGNQCHLLKCVFVHGWKGWIYDFSAGLCPKRNGRHVLRCWCRSQSLVHTWCTEGRADRKLLYKAALWTSYGILWNPAWVPGWLARNGHFRVGRFADFFWFPICGQTHLSATENFSGFKTIIQKGDSLLTWHILKLQCDNYMIYQCVYVCIGMSGNWIHAL